jgi:hypothetical protein
MRLQAAGLASILLMMYCTTATAQSKRQIKAAYRASPPKMILVELFTHTPKSNYFLRIKQPKKAAEVLVDAQSVIEKTVADFNENFHFCPVYYFYDTNAQLISNRNFEAALFNKDLTPVVTSPISDADTSYIIVNYGPAAISRKEYLPGATEETNNLSFGVSDNVLITSFKSNMLSYTFTPLPTFVLYDKKSIFRGNTQKYAYTSKRFNIYYKDQAEFLNNKFVKFFTGL